MRSSDFSLYKGIFNQSSFTKHFLHFLFFLLLNLSFFSILFLFKIYREVLRASLPLVANNDRICFNINIYPKPHNKR